MTSADPSLARADQRIAEFLARATARDGDPHDVVAAAQAAVTDGGAGSTREQLLRSVVVALEERDLLDDADVPDPAALGRLNPAGDRWAGWWHDDVEIAPFPAGVELDAETLLRALRRLPLRLRLLLILREAAGLDGVGVARVLGSALAPPAAEVDGARLGLVHYVGDELAASPS